MGLIWHEGKVLVGRRPEGVPLAGLDEFPGGKCLPDEEPAAAVVRECLEETGLRVEVERLRLQLEHDYPHGKLALWFFDCRLTPAGLAVPLPPFRWIARVELNTLTFPPANAAVLQSIVSE